MSILKKIWEYAIADLRGVTYRAYEARIRREIPAGVHPLHLGVILDGNRRWGANSTVGMDAAYRAGGAKILSLVDWCHEAGIKFVTLWLLSTDNLKRPSDELAPIYDAISDTLRQLEKRPGTRVLHSGARDQLPTTMALHLKDVEESTRDRDGITVSMAIAYGGKQEITDALRSWILNRGDSDISLEELARELTPEELEAHTYTKGQPPLDLIIRTSGEQRLSGFMLWHSTYAELYFCEALWPDFRRIDFWRALRSYAGRQRRFGK